MRNTEHGVIGISWSVRIIGIVRILYICPAGIGCNTEKMFRK